MSDEIVSVLRDVRSLLGRAGNDFAWSRWRDQADAISELDAWLERIDAGETIKLSELELLFAPTGSLQEVSVSSGWGDDFIRLADRFDAAVAEM